MPLSISFFHKRCVILRDSIITSTSFDLESGDSTAVNEGLADFLPEVNQANAMSEELDKKVR